MSSARTFLALLLLSSSWAASSPSRTAARSPAQAVVAPGRPAPAPAATRSRRRSRPVGSPRPRRRRSRYGRRRRRACDRSLGGTTQHRRAGRAALGRRDPRPHRRASRSPSTSRWRARAVAAPAGRASTPSASSASATPSPAAGHRARSRSSPTIASCLSRMPSRGPTPPASCWRRCPVTAARPRWRLARDRSTGSSRIISMRSSSRAGCPGSGRS